MQTPKKDSFTTGLELKKYALSLPDKLQRGSMMELFPFVYEASRKMGVRAISRWLVDQGTPISPATISRALNSPAPYWEGFWEIVEPHARRVSEAYAVPMPEFLLGDVEYFRGLLKEGPGIVVADQDTEILEADEVEASVDFLAEKWFPLWPATRAHMRAYVIEEQGK